VRRWFAITGAVGNFLSALFGSVEPLIAAFFLAYDLVKEAYSGTEAQRAARGARSPSCE
jgi:hypothetical protein